MKKSINLFIEQKISNPSKIIGGNGGTGTTTGANEQVLTSNSTTEID